MDVAIEDSWKSILDSEFRKDYFFNLVSAVKLEYNSNIVYPPANFIFRAFNLTPFDKVKVVILGQDPYHGTGQANGLCFAVNTGIKLPPSIKNIFKEIENDLGRKTSFPEGNLEGWANQGVLLLNSTLTVRAHTPASHQNIGWELFTHQVVKNLSEKKENLVFILWGNYAQKKGESINKERHLIIKSPHPSPFSAHNGFFGSRPFSKCNKYLLSHNNPEINW